MGGGGRVMMLISMLGLMLPNQSHGVDHMEDRGRWPFLFNPRFRGMWAFYSTPDFGKVGTMLATTASDENK
jgi:hypothetical protein